MSDDKIIEALECCNNCFCEGCSYKSQLIYCREALCSSALGLIYRQRAEIEKLKRNGGYRFCNLLGNALVYTKTLEDYNKFRKAFKTEAIKAFAEAIKMEFFREFDEIIPSIMADKIDNLVKEMTEGKA